MSPERLLRNPISIGLLTFFLSAFNFLAPKNDLIGKENNIPEKESKSKSEAYNRIESELNSVGIFMNEVQIFLRAFKYEETLELWAKNKTDGKFIKIKNYKFCNTSGNLGPKRMKGDLQIPEGFYKINHLNPFSNFYLSLGVSYPNRSDLILSKHKEVGGSIYIHGGCSTIGCIPITDEKIEELFILATAHTRVNSVPIGVHIFPAVMDSYFLAPLIAEYPNYEYFWRNLQAGYNWFEQNKTLPRITIDNKGLYHVSPDLN